jgi:hypothetical protein
MKILLTGVVVMCYAILSAQTVKVDLKEILLDKRDKIANNDIIILNNGKFQLKTKAYYYKFDSNGVPIGAPEANGSGDGKYSETATSYSDLENDIYYYYDGKSQFFVTKFKSDSPNEYASVPFPELADISSAGEPIYSSLETVDDDRFVLISAYKGRSPLTHNGIPSDKNKVDCFVRIVNINIKTKEVVESFRFINKIDAGKKDFNNIDISSFSLEGNKLRIGVLICNSINDSKEYSTYYTKVDGTYQLWDVDLDSEEETMVASVSVKTPENTRYCWFYGGSSGIYMDWTETIDKKQDGYALFNKEVIYDEGEWKEKTKKFPEDILTIRFPGYPLPVSSYKFPDGTYGYRIVGVLAKGPLDKNPMNRVFIFDQNDQVTIHDVKNSSVLIYKDGDVLKDYEEDHEVPAEFLESLKAPLLEKSKMNYLYKDNDFVCRLAGQNLIIIHYDWRATNSKPDYMIEITKLPL